MNRKLVLSVCNFMIPEVSQVIKNGDYPDVKLTGFASACALKQNINHSLLNSISESAGTGDDIIFIGSYCNSSLYKTGNLPDNVSEIYLEQCFELFFNKETIQHYISKGYYIATNGWLHNYQHNIKTWGFDKETAKVFFGESMKKILFLDTNIPGDAMKGLHALSEYMGLPFEVLPVGLSHCKIFIENIVNQWRKENTRRLLNIKIADATRQAADFSVIFNELGTLVNVTDESRIINMGLGLLNVLFAPVSVRFIQYLENEKQVFELTNQPDASENSNEKSFRIEVKYTGNVLGVFEVHGIRYPQFLSQYKQMGLVVSQIFGLSIANARKYKVIVDQSNALKDYAQELQNINHSKDKFFSIIAHDLKGPFNTLIGVSEMLVEEIQAGKEENISALSNSIHNTSVQTYNLLVNLLEWSRSQTGKIEFYPESLQLFDMVKEILEVLTYQAEKKQIRILNYVSRDFKIFGDNNMLTLIIRNLVSNAIKFTAAGGKITISARSVNNLTEISVRDTGVGITPANLKNLFSIEHNKSTPGTDKEKGTGLGLVLCREFVERHGGEIHAESVVGKGSVFYFTLADKKI